MIYTRTGSKADFAHFTTGISVHHQGRGDTITCPSVPVGYNYTVPDPYGSLWTVANEWALGKFNINANPLDDLDEQVLDDGTGNNVWRLSHTRTGSFSDQPNSPNSSAAAGESTASLWNARGPNHTRIRCDPYERANRCDKREQSICSETNPISPAAGSRR